MRKCETVKQRNPYKWWLLALAGATVGMVYYHAVKKKKTSLVEDIPIKANVAQTQVDTECPQPECLHHRPKSYTYKDALDLKARHEDGETIVSLAREKGISTATVYNAIKSVS